MGSAAGSLELGREAVKRHAWAAALDAFAAAEAEDPLSPDDLELMGDASWWAGRPQEATDLEERAFAAYMAADRPTDAARVAFHLSYEAFRRLAPSVGGGWLGRAAALLEGLPESGMHAWLHVFAGMGAVMEHRMDDGLAFADRALAVAREHGNADAQFLATSFKGYGEMHQGNLTEGLALLDAAAAAATSGQLDLRVASDILCNTIAACRNIGDLQRAGEWADEGERWMRRQAIGGYPGDLPRAPRRIEDAPRAMARSRARGAPGVRGAGAVRPARRAWLRPSRDRRDPAADGRSGGGGRGPRAGVRARR